MVTEARCFVKIRGDSLYGPAGVPCNNHLVKIEDIIANIDSEIARLTAARDALTGSGGGSKTRQPVLGNTRTWSAAARARQSQAMKKRWASGKMGGKRKKGR